jgi:hypothetical protein
MSFRHLLIVVVGLAVPAAALIGGGCGSTVTVAPAGQGGGGEGGGFLFLDAGEDVKDATPPPQDVVSDYTDPGCPDKPPPIYDYQCDPYDQNNGDCPPGEACYIYVDYPSEPCGQEIYGAYCYPEGTGSQGAPCAGGLDCAAGFVCVVSGSGNQCVQLCHLTGDSGCPPGFVCEPIDVEGFGGCI